MSASLKAFCALFVAVTLAVFAAAAEHTKDSLETVQKNVAAKKAVLLDVREQDEWKDGHLEDARFAPLTELRTEAGAKRLAKKLPRDKILYTHCVVGKRSVAAAQILRKYGYDVRPLKAGYRELLEAGFKKADDEP